MQNAAHRDELSDCLPNKQIECHRYKRNTSTNKIFFCGVFFLLHQDVPHGLDALVTIISTEYCKVSTCVAVINPLSSTKPNSGATGNAVGPMATKDTYSCSAKIKRPVTPGVKSFLVTVVLKGGIRTNQRLPCVTTQWSVAVLPISGQRVQGIRLLVDHNKPDLLADLHTEADLGEGCVPVGGKFGLLWVKPSLPSVKVEGFFVAPESGFVVKSLLWQKGGRNRKIVL